MNMNSSVANKSALLTIVVSLYVVGIGFLILGFTLFPVVGILFGIPILLLAGYLWRSSREKTISDLDIVIQILEQKTGFVAAEWAGTIPLAILTTSTDRGEPYDFDARTIDISTLRLTPSGTKPLDQAEQYDIDGDGDVDLVLHFPVSQFNNVSDAHEICITGATIRGRRVRGCTRHH